MLSSSLCSCFSGDGSERRAWCSHRLSARAVSASVMCELSACIGAYRAHMMLARGAAVQT